MPYEIRESFLSRLATPLICERLFEQIPDVVFCIKDTDGRYISANQAFANRRGLRSPRDIIGKTAYQIFAPNLASTYHEQDKKVFAGNEIIDQLELVTTPSGELGWHLATKIPLYDKQQNVIGLASISRDLKTPSDKMLKFAKLAKIIHYIQEHFTEDLKPKELAAKINLTQPQLDRKMRKVFGVSTSQFIRKVRIDTASNLLLKTKLPISTIAQNSGYSDQSAFSRQFKATTGLTPGAFRNS